jgi:hypothetical protein
MTPKDTLKRYLTARIERFMESGEPVLNLEYLSPAVEGQIDFLEECLCIWQSEGRIEWLKPIDLSNPKADIVRFKTYINKDVPWISFPRVD